MEGNPLKTREDVIQVMKDLYLPLKPYYSKGYARVRLDMAAASFDRTASDLEGFARPLWGLAPLAAGGGADFVDWELFREGLANGTNPEHPEFWGFPDNRDQRLVELAAIGFALVMIPEILWQPQSAATKKNIAHYLHHAYTRRFGENNWMFFRVMIGLGLQAIGESIEQELMDSYLDKLDNLYLDDGWYADGPNCRVDYYIPFAIHFYGLLYYKIMSLKNISSEKELRRLAQIKERANVFSKQFIRWFAEDGAALTFGRSLTYRFACGSFWSALAFADCEALPWGQIKGLVLRHLRWWSNQPIAHRDGVLSIGYAYPNLHMCESYNSAGSPYWAFKIFAFMSLPDNHPFWTSPEIELPDFKSSAVMTIKSSGMIMMSLSNDVIALAGGQESNLQSLRMAPEKYSKFAYSARYGFCVETNLRQFECASLDNMLGFSDNFTENNQQNFSVRAGNEIVKIADNLIYAKWIPNQDITVETWSLTESPWHIRIHRINSNKVYKTIEGGFALATSKNNIVKENTNASYTANALDFSGIYDLGSSISRTSRILNTLPNSNLINAITAVPQLLGSINIGETILITGVIALADPVLAQVAWQQPPKIPSIAMLEDIIKKDSCDVLVMRHKRF